jgi:hypothetical protein
MQRLQSMLALPLLLAGAAGEYPSCGDCWCVPEANGTGPCPVWEPQSNFSSAVINAYASQVPLNPYSLECNPYEDTACTTTPPQEFLGSESAVCALMYPAAPEGGASCAAYELRSFPSRGQAEAHGGAVTHGGACGLCSTAADLAVYLSEYPPSPPLPSPCFFALPCLA